VALHGRHFNYKERFFYGILSALKRDNDLLNISNLVIGSAFCIKMHCTFLTGNLISSFIVGNDLLSFYDHSSFL
jgi:hypothetical protein